MTVASPKSIRGCDEAVIRPSPMRAHTSGVTPASPLTRRLGSSLILLAWYALPLTAVALWVFSPVPPAPLGCVDSCFGPALERMVVGAFTVVVATMGVAIGLVRVLRQTDRMPSSNLFLLASRAAGMSLLMAAGPIVVAVLCLWLIARARS
jgi:hypothetical protein